jgi:hypothetical protein
LSRGNVDGTNECRLLQGLQRLRRGFGFGLEWEILAQPKFKPRLVAIENLNGFWLKDTAN